MTATYFFSRNVLGNTPGGNVPWTINENASNGTNVNLSDVHTFSANHCQSGMAHVHAGSGRTRQPAGDWPGVADPRIVRLELSHPGTARVAHHHGDQFLSDHDQCGSVHGF